MDSMSITASSVSIDVEDEETSLTIKKLDTLSYLDYTDEETSV